MNERPALAPTFTQSHDEPEPGVVSTGQFDDGSLPPRPKPQPSRTREETRAKGLAAPEDLEFRG